MEQEDIRQYLPHFVYALKKSGATQWMINSFRAYWNTLPSATLKPPCPLCYANGHEGGLTAVKSEAGAAIHCERCRREFLVVRH